MQSIDLLKSIPWFLIGLAIILRLRSLRIEGVGSTLVVIAYSIKMAGTLALQWLYTYFYTDRATADIYRFYDDGLILSKIASNNLTHYFKIMLNWSSGSENFRILYFEKMNSWIKPFESGFYNDNLIMIKLNSLFTLITQSGYEANSVLFSIMAFSGLILMIKTLMQKKEWRVGAIIIVTLLPSYLLFQSGGLKESVLLFGVGTLFHSINRISRTKIKWEGLLVAIIGCWFLINIKPYFIASIVPATLAFAIALKLKSRPMFSWAIWTLIIVFGILSISLSSFELLEYIVRKQHDFLNHAANIQPGSLIYIPRLEYTWESVIQSLPQSFWRTIMEPMPWSVHSLSLFIMFVENVIILTVISVGSFRLIKNRNLSLTSHFLIQSVIPGLCLIGLISPVLGATMRYRSPFIILLLLAFVPLFINQKAKNSHNEV